MLWFRDNLIGQGLAVVAILLLLVLLVIRITLFCSVFKKELRQIKNEICRTKGSEREYWVRRRRKLWLSLLPFVKY